MKPALVVMAAGVGSRYGGLKQIDAVGTSGEGIIDYSVYDAARSGFGKVVFIIRKDIEKDFREIIGKKHEKRLDVSYAFQQLSDVPAGFAVPEDRKKPWGTAHAVLTVASLVDVPFAVINGDDFYGVDAYRALGRYLQSLSEDAREFALVGYTLRNTLSDHGTVSRGVCRMDDDGFLDELVERLKIEKCSSAARALEGEGHVDLSGDEIVSMNMFGFTPAVFPLLRQRFASFIDRRGGDPKAEFLLPDEVGRMVAEKLIRVKVITTSAEWFGITYREDRESVVRSIRSLVQQGGYPEKLD